MHTSMHPAPRHRAAGHSMGEGAEKTKDPFTVSTETEEGKEQFKKLDYFGQCDAAVNSAAQPNMKVRTVLLPQAAPAPCSPPLFSPTARSLLFPSPRSLSCRTCRSGSSAVSGGASTPRCAWRSPGTSPEARTSCRLRSTRCCSRTPSCTKPSPTTTASTHAVSALKSMP
eukprot:SAG22_NODE_173_length_16589_cov_120.738933_10_plen_170_part_00